MYNLNLTLKRKWHFINIFRQSLIFPLNFIVLFKIYVALLLILNIKTLVLLSGQGPYLPFLHTILTSFLSPCEGAGKSCSPAVWMFKEGEMRSLTARTHFRDAQMSIHWRTASWKTLLS